MDLGITYAPAQDASSSVPLLTRDALLKQDLRHFPFKPVNDLLCEVKTGFVDFPDQLLLQLVKAERLSERSTAFHTAIEDDDPNEEGDETLTAKGRMKYLCALGKARFSLIEAYCFPAPQSRDFIPGCKLLLKGLGVRPQLELLSGHILIHSPSQITWMGGDVESQALAYEESRRVKQSRQQGENRVEASIKFIPFGHPQPPLLSRLSPPEYWRADAILQNQFAGPARTKATDIDASPYETTETHVRTKPKDVTSNKLIAGRGTSAEDHSSSTSAPSRGGRGRGGSGRGSGRGRSGGGRRRGGRGRQGEGISVTVQGGRTFYGATSPS